MYLGSTYVDCISPHVLPSFMQIRACESKKMLLDVVSLHFKIQGGLLHQRSIENPAFMRIFLGISSFWVPTNPVLSSQLLKDQHGMPYLPTHSPENLIQNPP